MSYSLSKHAHSVLFAGDMILPTPSVAFSDLKQYMDSLHTLQAHKFDEIYFSHTATEHEVSIPAPAKI
jgi:glyoxylase-like metal-dependent hydrolase (beta-lactamase superfamily II)